MAAAVNLCGISSAVSQWCGHVRELGASGVPRNRPRGRSGTLAAGTAALCGGSGTGVGSGGFSGMSVHHSQREPSNLTPTECKKTAFF
jgi:hypothetical protein